MLFLLQFIGVVQQKHTEHDSMHCLNDFCSLMGSNSVNCPYKSQIRFIEFLSFDSRGLIADSDYTY